MSKAYLPRSELIIIELRSPSAATYTYATNLYNWRDEAICACRERGPRTVFMFHWGKREVMGVYQWVLLAHEEQHIDCF